MKLNSEGKYKEKYSTAINDSVICPYAYEQSESNPPVFDTVEKYLSESNRLRKYLPKALADGKNITLQAPAGIGKSYTTINELATNLVLNYNKVVIFAMPFTVQVDQTKEDISDPEKGYSDVVRANVKIYGKGDKIEKDLEQTKPAVICTYDKANLAFEQLESLIDTQSSDFILIVDESQFLVKSRSYRKQTINQIELLHKKASAVLQISATPNRALDTFKSFETIVIERKQNPFFLFEIKEKSTSKNWESKETDSTKGGQTLDLFIEISRKLKAGKRVFAFVNDYSVLIQVKQMFILSGQLQESEISIFTGNKTNERTKEENQLSENSTFGEGVKLVLSTEVLLQAVNIKNLNFEQIYYPTQSKDLDPRNMVQFVARMRAMLGAQDVVKCTVFLDSDFIKKPVNKFNEHYKLKELYGIATKARERAEPLSKKIGYSKALQNAVKDLNIKLSAKFQYSAKQDYIHAKDGKIIISDFAIGESAFNEKMKYLTLHSLKQEITDYSPANTCLFSVSANIPSFDEINQVNEFTPLAKGYYKNLVLTAKTALIKDIETDERKVLGMAKELSKDIHLLNRISENFEGYTEGYKAEITDKRLYYDSLSNYVFARFDFGQKLALQMLITEVLPNEAKKGKVLKTLRKTQTAFHMAKALSVFEFIQDKNIPESAKQAMFYKNTNMRFSMNLFYAVTDAIRLNDSKIDKRRNELKNELKQAENEYLTISTRNKKKRANKENEIKQLRSKLKGLKRDFFHAYKYKEVYDFLQTVSPTVENSNFSKDHFVLLAKLFTNAETSEKNIVLKANTKIDYSAFEYETGLNISDIKESVIADLEKTRKAELYRIEQIAPTETTEQQKEILHHVETAVWAMDIKAYPNQDNAPQPTKPNATEQQPETTEQRPQNAENAPETHETHETQTNGQSLNRNQNQKESANDKQPIAPEIINEVPF